MGTATTWQTPCRNNATINARAQYQCGQLIKLSISLLDAADLAQMLAIIQATKKRLQEYN
jgi:hypothetical protein